jgi:hypothetical protein
LIGSLQRKCDSAVAAANIDYRSLWRVTTNN